MSHMLAKAYRSHKILILIVIAFLIRFIGINQSLWLDEATTVRVVQQFSFVDIIAKFSVHDFHPPLFYLFMKLWTTLFGYSEMSLRFPFILFSLGTGYVIYLIGKVYKSDKTNSLGFWAAALFLFNPLIIYYSQEARMYMMVTFFLTTALYYFIQLYHPELGSGSETSRNKFGMTVNSHIILFSLCIILSFFTFYGSIFMIASFFIYLLYQKRYKPFLVTGLLFFLSFLLISPLLYAQWIHSKIALAYVINWKLVLGQATLKNLFLIPLKFSIGRISFSPKLIYYALSLPWTIIVFFAIIKGALKNKFLLFFFVTPLILGILFSFFSPLLQYFRFLYLIPLMSLLIVYGIDRSWQKKLILLGFIIWSFIYLLLPQFYREDWKSLVQSLSLKDTVYMVGSTADPVKYYMSDMKVNDILSIQKQPIREKEIVVIPATIEVYGFDYKIELGKQGFTLKKQQSYRQLLLEYWTKP